MSPNKIILILNVICLFINIGVGIFGTVVIFDARKMNRDFKKKYDL